MKAKQRNLKRSIPITLLAFAASIGFADSLCAAVLVTNGSFQTPTTVTFTTTGPTGWNDEGSDSRSVTQNQAQSAISGGLGDQYGVIDQRSTAGGINQNVGTIVSNADYQFKILVAKANNSLPTAFAYGLYGGATAATATVIAFETQADVATILNSTSATFFERTLSFTTTGGAHIGTVGQNLYVRIFISGGDTGAANQLAFDNVRVTEVIPEPSTCAMLLGAIGLLLIHRRR